MLFKQSLLVLSTHLKVYQSGVCEPQDTHCSFLDSIKYTHVSVSILPVLLTHTSVLPVSRTHVSVSV